MQGSMDKEKAVADQRNNILLYFFFSAQENNLAEKCKLLAQNAQHPKLANICLTRSVDGVDDMSIFEELLLSIYYSLHEKKENKYEPRSNHKTSDKVGLLIKLVTDFSFFPQ